ncbi:MAG TPA: LacI family DNA-binding transcriptional regulator [Candidatus Methylacidiphilales bacterium]
MVTLRDLGRLLGVTHSTVSRALRNSPTISPARRLEIQQAAARLGYRPNAVATRLGHQRRAGRRVSIDSGIAWLNFWPRPEKLRSFGEFDAYWEGARERAESTGYRLEEFVCGKRMSARRLERVLAARNIQGVLIPPHGLLPRPEGWDRIDWSRFCIVRFGYSTAEPASHLVASNQLACGILAIENMWRLGYRRIGFVASANRFFNFQAGFLTRQAQVEGNPPVCTFVSSRNPKSKLEEFARWLRTHRPDALLSELPETRGMLESLGYRIPRDIGLAATSVLDGNADAGVNQNSREIGRAAVETLLSLLNHNQYGVPAVPREVLITGGWVDGPMLPPR